jgi:hypothetical protein
MRENLYERRKNRAAINEGTNDTERKALASMRSDPELMIETRYFALKSLLEAVQQLLTTKSVEASRDRTSGSEEERSF